MFNDLQLTNQTGHSSPKPRMFYTRGKSRPTSATHGIPGLYHVVLVVFEVPRNACGELVRSELNFLSLYFLSCYSACLFFGLATFYEQLPIALGIVFCCMVQTDGNNYS